MKKLFLVFFSVCIINPLILTACWNYRDIDRLTIVSGVAIDKTEEGKYLITVETPDMHQSGKEVEVQSVVIHSEGETIFDAARNVINQNFPRLYWGHAAIIVISQDVAREGVVGILDFFNRDAETRLDMNLLVSEGETANEIFDAEPLTASIISTELAHMLKEEKSLSKALRVQVYEFVNALGEEGKSGVMASVCLEEINGKKNTKLCGTAIFKADKLLGFINHDETKNLSFALDKVKGGILVVDTGTDGGHIALEILENKTTIKPVYLNNKLSIQLNIETKVALAEHDSEGNFINEKGRAALKKAAEEQLKKAVESTIRKIQKDFNSDVFGFGNHVYRNLPEVWKIQGKEWKENFKDLKVSVNTSIDIENSGLLYEPIKIGE